MKTYEKIVMDLNKMFEEKAAERPVSAPASVEQMEVLRRLVGMWSRCQDYHEHMEEYLDQE